MVLAGGCGGTNSKPQIEKKEKMQGGSVMKGNKYFNETVSCLCGFVYCERT